jgi:hypothetical protein
MCFCSSLNLVYVFLIFNFKPQLNSNFTKSELDSYSNILKTKHAGDNANQKKYKQKIS